MSESLGWKQARRTAFVQDVVAAFTQRPEGLLSFEQVSAKLKLGSINYLDVQDIPLDQIVGSVGRYTDFTRAFFPRGDHLQSRWQNIEQLIAAGRPLPPIELYKVGEAYFVRDGNHRVSVARQRGIASLRAQVWEYETAVPLQPDSDVDELLCQIAHTAFLEQTNIDLLCPGVEIRLTQPGGYEDLLHELEIYQQILSAIDRRDLPFDEAIMLWCELRYTPIVGIIREGHVLDEFPGRTETDLYLWLCRNRRELEASYGHHVLMKDAADDLTERFGRQLFPIRRLKEALSRATRWWRTLR